MKILDAYTKPLRSFLANDFYATRKALNLTQMEMAEMLDIDPRAYSDLERSESLCSTRVFLRYMFHCKSSREEFLEDLANLLKSVEDSFDQ